jgi:hypothetical protein
MGFTPAQSTEMNPRAGVNPAPTLLRLKMITAGQLVASAGIRLEARHQEDAADGRELKSSGQRQ